MYRFSMKVGKVGYAKNHASYILRENNYSYKEDLIYSQTGNTEFVDGTSPLKFWETADNNERIDGVTYREFELAIPNELKKESSKIINEFISKEIGNDHVYTYAIHESLNKENQPNLHCHLMFSERTLNEKNKNLELFFKRANSKNPELGGAKKNVQWRRKEKLLDLRKSWEVLLNKHLKEQQIDKQVSCLSLRTQKENALLAGDKNKADLFDREAIQISRNILNKNNKNIPLSKKEGKKFEEFENNKRIRNEKEILYSKKVSEKTQDLNLEREIKNKTNEIKDTTKQAYNILSNYYLEGLLVDTNNLIKKEKILIEQKKIESIYGSIDPVREASLVDLQKQIKLNDKNYQDLIDTIDPNKLKNLIKKLDLEKQNEKIEFSKIKKENSTQKILSNNKKIMSLLEKSLEKHDYFSRNNHENKYSKDIYKTSLRIEALKLLNIEKTKEITSISLVEKEKFKNIEKNRNNLQYSKLLLEEEKISKALEKNKKINTPKNIEILALNKLTKGVFGKLRNEKAILEKELKILGIEKEKSMIFSLDRRKIDTKIKNKKIGIEGNLKKIEEIRGNNKGPLFDKEKTLVRDRFFKTNEFLEKNQKNILNNKKDLVKNQKDTFNNKKINFVPKHISKNLSTELKKLFNPQKTGGVNNLELNLEKDKKKEGLEW